MGVALVTLTGFQIEGNLIAPDLTDELLTGNFKGQTSEDFGFSKADKLADEIAIAWGDAKAYWAAFQRGISRLPEGDLATTLTREQWTVPLLRSLGYDPIYVARAEVVDGQTYAISHRADPGENKPPIHVVGCRVGVEQRPPSGTPRLSAHALMQEYLNRTEHLWGVVTNGLQWRLLRDSSLMTRLTYVEFDLEQILNGENFAEFGLFYRLFHRSRLPQGMDDADECLLEFYHQEALQQGGRVRDRLRDGVEKALNYLGNGFLQYQYAGNDQLRQKLQSGELTQTSYYRQLLTLIYRLLFLMVAESRDLLLGESEPEKVRIYREYYSVERLRLLAERHTWRREEFQDLWQGLGVTFRLLDENWRGQLLGLSPLNGDLFGSGKLRELDQCGIDNHDLLLAIRHLSLYKSDRNDQLRRVNYAALDVEELGSVYESLLDFHPQVTQRQGIYEFQLVVGSERKSTGSYYTPRELATCLIRLTIEPIIADRLKDLKTAEEKIEALRNLRVIDPACGSGSLLLAAARRIGLEIARIRTGEIQPSVKALRLATREAIQNCVYGVDINPLSVELCRVTLWIEGFCQGYPLNVLDYRIKCGNSLVGVLDLDCLTSGIPDAAFKPVGKDEKNWASNLKKRNKKEREQINQLTLAEDIKAEDLPQLAEKRRSMEVMPENTVNDIKQKEKREDEIRRDPQWWQNIITCNLWTTAFFLPLTEQNLQLMPTTEVLARYARDRRNNQSTLYSIEPIIEKANQIAEEKRFFHWALEFPEIFEQRGFDCVLANPPWERIKLQEKEFFAARSVEIVNATNKSEREKLIKELPKRNPELSAAWDDAKHFAEAQICFVRESGRFPLTAIGDVNTYALFAELVRNLLSSHGKAGIIVPTGIATDDTCKKFFGDLTQKQNLVSLYDFENREKLFSAVDSRMKFSLLCMSGQPIAQANFAFFLTKPKQVDERSRLFQLFPQDIALLNPNTLTCSVFRTRTDAELTHLVAQRNPERLATKGVSFETEIAETGHVMRRLSSPTQSKAHGNTPLVSSTARSIASMGTAQRPTASARVC